MSYSLLALKYRPQTFADVVGQEHITRFLRLMSVRRSLPPALVFAGPRATGKTTTARIIAAAMNCTNVGPDGDPCTVCVPCQEVRRGSSLDVLEVDAASHTGIDNIRTIKDSLGYGSTARWRIILLDEAHSLSPNAFNALLKVLEEPPPNVSFVLLTTEADKILDTILSRSMYFEFQRHTSDQVFQRLTHVTVQEGFDISTPLLWEMVRAGQGGLRDSLMLLDQIVTTGVTSVAEFRRMYGRPDYSLDLVEAVVNRDVVTALDVVEQHFRRTGEVATLVRQMAEVLRDIVVIRAGGSISGFDEDVARTSSVAARVSAVQAVSLMKILWDLYARVGSGRDRAVLDLAVVEMASVVGTPWESMTAAPVEVEPEVPERALSLDEVVDSLGI